MSEDKIDLAFISFFVVLVSCIIGLMYFSLIGVFATGFIGTTQITEETTSTGIENVTITDEHIIIEPEESDNLRTVYILGENDSLDQTEKKLSPDQSEIKFDYYRVSGLYPFNNKYTYNIVIQDGDSISHKQITTQNSLF